MDHQLARSRSDGFNKLYKALDNSVKEKESSRVIVITSNSCQYISVRSSISDIAEVSLPSGLLCEKGYYKKGKSCWEIILCEIGNYSNYPSKTISELMRFFTPRVVFRLSFAFGLRDSNVGDIVISTNSFVQNLDNNNIDINNFPTIKTSTVSIEQRARLESKKETWFKLSNNSNYISNRKPRILFGPSLVTSQLISVVPKKIHDQYPNIMAVEMETFSIAEAIEDISQKFELLTLLGILDTSDRKKDDNYINITSNQMSTFLFEVLANY